MSLRTRTGSLLLLAVLVGCSGTPPASRDPGPPEVTWAYPTVEKLTETTDMTGALAAVDFVEVRPRVSGFILEVRLKDGEEVTAGKVLFEIDPAPYKATLDQAKAQVASYEAQFKLADADLARNAKLIGSGAVSREEYDQTVAKKAVALAEIDGARAALARAQLDYDWTKVTAPIAGRADRVLVTKGNVVTGGLSQGTVLTTIVSTDKVYAYFDVNEQVFDYYIDQVKKGRFTKEEKGVPVQLALQGDKGYPHKGTIDFSGNRFSPSTGSLQLRAVIDDPGKEMVAGRQIKARVPLSNPYDAVLIPDEALVSDLGKKIVYVIDDKDVARARPVTIGPKSHGLRVIPAGLEKTDRVVVKGQQRLRPDVTVKPIQEKKS